MLSLFNRSFVLSEVFPGIFGVGLLGASLFFAAIIKKMIRVREVSRAKLAEHKDNRVERSLSVCAYVLIGVSFALVALFSRCK